MGLEEAWQQKTLAGSSKNRKSGKNHCVNTREQREHGWKRLCKALPDPELSGAEIWRSWKFQVPFHDPSKMLFAGNNGRCISPPISRPMQLWRVLGAARLSQPGSQGLEGRARAARSSGGRRARATLTRPHLTPPHPELHLADSPSRPSIHVKGKGCRPSQPAHELALPPIHCFPLHCDLGVSLLTFALPRTRCGRKSLVPAAFGTTELALLGSHKTLRPPAFLTLPGHPSLTTFPATHLSPQSDNDGFLH